MRQLPFEYAFRNLGRSRTRLLSSLIGATLVVLLAMAATAFVRGMEVTLSHGAGLHTNVIVLGAGSEESVERSQIDASVAGIVASSVRGLQQAGNVPLVSPEINTMLPVRIDPEGEAIQSVIRGVRPKIAVLVHPQVEMIEGRLPQIGSDEIMVGKLSAVRLGLPDERLAIGQKLYFDNRGWEIVGRFAAPSTVMDAEIWMPITDLQIATKREGTISSVVVALDTAKPSDIDLLTKTRLDLEIASMTEDEYYAGIAAFYQPIRVMVIITAVLIGLGGLLGGLNTMYAAFSARVREVGMLQSLGFRRSAIVLNLTEESLFAAACGAVLGLAIGYLVLDGFAVRFSMGAFEMNIDGVVMLVALLCGGLVGLVGAIPPSIRCLRLPIPAALKSL
ncbi:MAG: ABC transporter permease [Phycisphaerales bacterium JB050]